jgi:hypothetical protein
VRLLAPPAVPRHHTPASVRSPEAADEQQKRRSVSELAALSWQLPRLGNRTPSVKNRRGSRGSQAPGLIANAAVPLTAAGLLKQLGTLWRRLQVTASQRWLDVRQTDRQTDARPCAHAHPSTATLRNGNNSNSPGLRTHPCRCAATLQMAALGHLHEERHDLLGMYGTRRIESNEVFVHW